MGLNLQSRSAQARGSGNGAKSTSIDAPRQAIAGANDRALKACA
jgi:hypothetical protein